MGGLTMDDVRTKEAIYIALSFRLADGSEICDPAFRVMDLIRCRECGARDVATDGSLYCTHWSRKVPEMGFCHLAVPDPAKVDPRDIAVGVCGAQAPCTDDASPGASVRHHVTPRPWEPCPEPFCGILERYCKNEGERKRDSMPDGDQDA